MLKNESYKNAPPIGPVIVAVLLSIIVIRPEGELNTNENRARNRK